MAAGPGPAAAPFPAPAGAKAGSTFRPNLGIPCRGLQQGQIRSKPGLGKPEKGRYEKRTGVCPSHCGGTGAGFLASSPRKSRARKRSWFVVAFFFFFFPFASFDMIFAEGFAQPRVKINTKILKAAKREKKNPNNNKKK